MTNRYQVNNYMQHDYYYYLLYYVIIKVTGYDICHSLLIIENNYWFTLMLIHKIRQKIVET